MFSACVKGNPEGIYVPNFLRGTRRSRCIHIHFNKFFIYMIPVEPNFLTPILSIGIQITRVGRTTLMVVCPRGTAALGLRFQSRQLPPFYCGLTKFRPYGTIRGTFHSGRQDLNLQPLLPKSSALPIELRPVFMIVPFNCIALRHRIVPPF